MTKLDNPNLIKVKGGSVAAGVAIFSGVCVAISFIASVIYGFVHPKGCD